MNACMNQRTIEEFALVLAPKRRKPTQQDVGDHASAPQVDALVVPAKKREREREGVSVSVSVSGVCV